MSQSPQPSILISRRPSIQPAVRRLTIFLVLALACRSAESITLPGLVELKTITIDSVTQLVLERGSRDTLSATTIDKNGRKVVIPVAWRSANDKIATFERGGAIVAIDTGLTTIVATSLGVVSPPVAVRVNWFGPAGIVAGTWTRKNATSPNATLTDSLRVVVTNIYGAKVPNAKVLFTVTEGGGSVSPSTTTTGPMGIAAAQWTLGPATGRNTVTASVIRDDGTLNPLVAGNLVTFSINSYNALTLEAGDNQTGQILSELPVASSVKLVDSLGVPRTGVPVVFTAFQNGRVATPVVSTDANGVASPGKWTLGDIPGQQFLEAKVEDAKISLRANATGTPIYYTPASVAAGGFSTCALESGGTVKCWGASPQNGSGTDSSFSTPRAVSGSLTAASLAGGSTHYCALTSAGAVWCWGLNALTDTAGDTLTTNKPRRLQSGTAWSQMSTGFSHNCGIGGQAAYCWGNNAAGQLGDLTTTNRFVPAPVTGGFRFSQLSSGTNHSCGLATDGTALCWGGNGAGQIGDGTSTARTSPTSVTGGQTFQSVGAGEGFTCGLTTQGQAYCWGGLSGTPQSTPTSYTGAPTFTSLSAGGAHACALTADGVAYCWGSNAWGQLGDSTTTTRASPTAVAGGMRFAQISAGYQHTCARATDGAVACWGRNTAGELGNNASAFQTTPRFIVLGVTP